MTESNGQDKARLVMAAMFYGGAALIGIGAAVCWTLSAWGVVPVVIGAALVTDVFVP